MEEITLGVEARDERGKGPRVGCAATGKVPGDLLRSEEQRDADRGRSQVFRGPRRQPRGLAPRSASSPPSADLQKQVALVREVQHHPGHRRHPARRLLRGRSHAAPAGHGAAALRRQGPGHRRRRHPAADPARNSRSSACRPTSRSSSRSTSRRSAFTTRVHLADVPMPPNVDGGLRDQRGRRDRAAADGRRSEGRRPWKARSRAPRRRRPARPRTRRSPARARDAGGRVAVLAP